MYKRLTTKVWKVCISKTPHQCASRLASRNVADIIQNRHPYSQIGKKNNKKNWQWATAEVDGKVKATFLDADMKWAKRKNKLAAEMPEK